MTRVVEAASAAGLTMHPLSLLTLGLFRRGPTWDIQCGQCWEHFSAQLPCTDYPVLRCEWCGTPNRLNLVWGR